ncbi:MAG: hypothetical protein JWP97_2785 [Labilithrix sp.]|nr:hypothetical protein [Labilithrix sp.]
MKTPEELELECRVRALYQQARPTLDESARAAVVHYLDHDEFEMAFEGLCIELVTSGSLSVDDARELVELAVALGLETDAVLDQDIVAKLRSV